MTLDELIAALIELKNVRGDPTVYGSSKVYVRCQLPNVDGWLRKENISVERPDESTLGIIVIKGEVGA